MRRTGFAVVGVLAGGVLLGGCSPAMLSLAAVSLGEDGEPVVTVRPCGDDRVDSLTLDGIPGERPVSYDPHRTAWQARSDAGIGDVTFPLFAPPRSWGVRPQGAQRLTPGYGYWLESGPTGGGFPYRVVVSFTTEELAGLGPGEVWADGRAMSRGEFEELVGDVC
ncbi:hypothetical protein [Streptomyces sp. NPDC001536]|uniref:hypothetical protein n=1 Tax=Streptomyces sp. NPDC001536 TaxID=3364583 RepID=UPI00369AD422